MKIKFIKTILILIFICFNSNINAETVFFDSKNLKIEEEGNMIYATKGVATIPLKNLKIIGDKFIYDRLNSELIIFDNVQYFDKDNKIIIKSQKMIYNELTNNVTLPSIVGFLYYSGSKLFVLITLWV